MWHLFTQTFGCNIELYYEEKNICQQGVLWGREKDHNKYENRRIELSAMLWGGIVLVCIGAHSSVWKNKKYSEDSKGGVKRK